MCLDTIEERNILNARSCVWTGVRVLYLERPLRIHLRTPVLPYIVMFYGVSKIFKEFTFSHSKELHCTLRVHVRLECVTILLKILLTFFQMTVFRFVFINWECILRDGEVLMILFNFVISWFPFLPNKVFLFFDIMKRHPSVVDKHRMS